ncbi:myo-inositol-1(or 4)-monophosphatase [Kineococcus xinjiangensis]|uniref:Myo-inositol-1(Or 4)-monophosphatase n=1 Tax=Kineococcus xinjiangensis TaxID=512762 RepID=A0A2S6IVW7_9ACTN|nr:inositol monophosphatase family protein [Kineococcus xinjiangensis]PPK98380.1 myo-inositol-1(or 4)-monophosphatase [Kineococcus xinjiangensis]
MSGAARTPDGTSVADLLAVAERVARAAGRLVHEGRPARVEVAATKSTVTDVVTAMDTAAEQLLREELAALRPDDGVLGEEHGYEPGTSGLTWVVDPIDGTVNYLYGIPAYAVSVAVVADPAAGPDRAPDPATWRVLAGCVHNPAGAETWTAGAGLGARLDGVLLQRSEGPQGAEASLETALVATGFGYDPVRRAEQAAVLAGLLPRVRDVRRIGTASLDLCGVAARRTDAYYERGLNPWDFAAALLVATETGVRVTDFAGGPAGGAGLLAARPALHAPLLQALADAGA